MNLSPEMLLEAALLTAPEAVDEATLCRLCEPPASPDELQLYLQNLQKRWQNRGLALVKTAAGWRFQVCGEAFARLGQWQQQRPPRYSRAVLETLAVIAYKQPVTRSDIEAVRGVSVSPNVMQVLQERGWIAAAGQRDSIGKPTLWATTAAFLSDFGLDSLNALPPLAELGEVFNSECFNTQGCT